MLVPDDIRKCAVFLGFKNKDGEFKWGGTAFFIGMPVTLSSGSTINFIYLVTANHVINDIQRYGTDGNVYLRINQKDGKAIEIPTPILSWKPHPKSSSVDVAVYGFLNFPQHLFDYLIFPISMFATDIVIEGENIGVGDELFFTGLFFPSKGEERNIPIVRIGNIAAMPEEPVATNVGKAYVYLAEARSIGGLSGSPVFVHLGNPRLPNVIVANSKTSVFYLLGLMHGHWEIETPNNASYAQQELVNMGIAMVVPAKHILEVINQPELEDARTEEIERAEAEN